MGQEERYKTLEKELTMNGLTYTFPQDVAVRFAKRIGMENVPSADELDDRERRISFHRGIIEYISDAIPADNKDEIASGDGILYKLAQTILMVGGYDGQIPYDGRYFRIPSGVPVKPNGKDIIGIVNTTPLSKIVEMALNNLGGN